MQTLFYTVCNAFLNLASFIGQFDISVMCRGDYYQPPVPEKLLKR